MWNVGGVTDMRSNSFQSSIGDLNVWNVGSVTDMGFTCSAPILQQRPERVERQRHFNSDLSACYVCIVKSYCLCCEICTHLPPRPVLTLALAPQLIPSRTLPDLDTARFQARAYARGKAASGRTVQELTSGLVTPASSQ